MVGGRWSAVSGRWSAVSGRWSVAHGRWSVDGGFVLCPDERCRIGLRKFQNLNEIVVVLTDND